MAAWAQALATVVAVVVGGLVAYLLRDQQRAKVHEKRLDAYARLWELTKEFKINGRPIDSERRQDLADELTEWYFQPGGGMLLTDQTRDIFLKLRANLTCNPTAFAPRSWQALMRPEKQDEQSCDRRRFLLLQRQFSLLRTQLKNDCVFYYGRNISGDRLFRPYDVDFLEDNKLQNIGIWKRAAKAAKEISKQRCCIGKSKEQCHIEWLEERYQGAPDSPIRLG
jgi:hypothetical protein